MYYKYVPCKILSHDFDEKSEFLNYEFSMQLLAITQFKNGQVQKRVGSREDVTSTNQTTQRLDSIFFSKASVDKNTQRSIKHEPRTPLLHTKVATFVLMS